MTRAAATTTAVFQAFVERVLLPALRQRQPGAVVVRDHLQPDLVVDDTAAPVRAALHAAGVTVHDRPPNSPDVSPMEPCWSNVKAGVRDKEARSRDALDAELPGGLDTVTAQDA